MLLVSEKFVLIIPDQARIADFQLMMMDIESEHLGIPDTDYEVTVRMPSAELQRIIRDLASFGDSGAFSCITYTLLLQEAYKDLMKLSFLWCCSHDHCHEGRYQIFNHRRYWFCKYHMQTQRCY